MDPFEARIYFSKQLTSLTPSKQAAQDLAHFLIRNSEIRDDLFPAVLETLHRVDLNARISVLQFLDELVSTIVHDPKHDSTLSPAYGYVALTVKGLPCILAEVLPIKPTVATTELEDMRCLTNLQAAYSILVDISKLLQFPDLEEYTSKFNTTLLTVSDVESIKQAGSFAEAFLYDDLIKQKVSGEEKQQQELVPLLHQEKVFVEPLKQAWQFVLGKKRQSQYERVMIDTHPGNLRDSLQRPESASTDNAVEHRNPLLLSRKQMLQRMEADRERQKRGKETLWKVDRPNNEIHITEFMHTWNSLDRYDPKADKALLDELNGLYNICRGDGGNRNRRKQLHLQSANQRTQFEKAGLRGRPQQRGRGGARGGRGGRRNNQNHHQPEFKRRHV